MHYSNNTELIVVRKCLYLYDNHKQITKRYHSNERSKIYTHNMLAKSKLAQIRNNITSLSPYVQTAYDTVSHNQQIAQ